LRRQFVCFAAEQSLTQCLQRGPNGPHRPATIRQLCAMLHLSYKFVVLHGISPFVENVRALMVIVDRKVSRNIR
jgi:hypothetical protein